MADTGLVQPIDLSDEEKEELEGIMVAAYESFHVTCKLLYKEWDVRRLRRDYIAGSKGLNRFAAARGHFQRLEEIAPRVLAGFVKISVKLCDAFYTSNQETHTTVLYSDYMTEAQMAIWDSMFSYNGESQFCTYAYGAVKNRLIEFLRYEEKIGGISRGIRKLRTKVKELMSQRHVSFENAVATVAEMDGVDEGALEQLRDAMYFMQELDSSNGSDPEAARESEDTQAMREVVATTGLNDLERELVEAHVRGDRGFRRKVCEERINPNTDRPYTRMCLSLIFTEACDKLRSAYYGVVDVRAA